MAAGRQPNSAADDDLIPISLTNEPKIAIDLRMVGGGVKSTSISGGEQDLGAADKYR